MIATETIYSKDYSDQRITYLKEVIATVLWGDRRNPVGHDIVSKRIIEPFKHFMAECADILTIPTLNTRISFISPDVGLQILNLGIKPANVMIPMILLLDGSTTVAPRADGMFTVTVLAIVGCPTNTW